MLTLEDKILKKLLLSENYVTEDDIKKVETFAKLHRVFFSEALLSEGYLTKDLLGQAIAEYFKVTYSDLDARQPPREQVLKIPEAVAKKLRAVLFFEDSTGVVVTTDNPTQKNFKEELKNFFPHQTITVTYSSPEDINISFLYYQKPLETRFSKIIAEKKKVAPEILEEIFTDAIYYKTSDIHFDPQPKEVVVRFRVDGVLREAGRLQKEQYENILNRIKVQSLLRIDEHFSAQDGSIHYERDGATIDLRTSIVPTVEGEKIVLRVLSTYIQGLSLTDLGLSQTHQKMLEEAARKPFGMILVAGPTGSGKTTTLYALLKLLNEPDVNITTIEDPVEYKMFGINQIQVRAQSNLTFAKGLRSIARQDPDIILVGEIRDEETAEIAVNAALTGHLLFSTFHANDAATAIPRLLDMGIEPFLLSSTLEVIIAQRLVRKICTQCRFSVPASSPHHHIMEKYFEKKSTVYKGKGCSTCGSSGYKGRTAIFEFIRVTPEMQNLMLKSPSTQELWALAREQGATSLFEDGIEKVKNGITTLEELLRVAEPPILNK